MSCVGVRAVALAAVLAVLTAPATAFLPMQNPPWAPTYVMNRSTLAMLENSNGWLDVNFTKNFGIVSIDWSNDKKDWVLARPMDDEERMVEQARAIKLVEPTTRVFVYRNLVKALPWWTCTREILEDPAYAGFFLKFKPQGPYHVPKCTTYANVTKCSDFYHDQTQSPAVPTPQNPNPDGACNVTCDCGKTIPCGEYLWDHRNASLRAWLIDRFIISPTAVGSPMIDGLFIDDYWCSDILSGSCGDPVQGPTEVDRHSQADMGLSDEDIKDLTVAWAANMEAVQAAILRAGGYTWSLIPGQAYANAGPTTIYKGGCQSFLNSACTRPNPNNGAPLLFGMQGRSNYNQQAALFLLARGPYAWIGWGQWGMTWPNDEPLPQAVWGSDYGEPLEDSCSWVAPGVYQRKYAKATIKMNCTAWEATFDWN